MEPTKTRTFIVRFGIALGMIIFAVACWYRAKMEGAVEFEDIMRYKHTYYALLAAAFVELAALAFYQIKPHMSRSKIEIKTEPEEEKAEES